MSIDKRAEAAIAELKQGSSANPAYIEEVIRRHFSKPGHLEEANKRLLEIASLATDNPVAKDGSCFFVDGIGDVSVEQYFKEFHEPPTAMRERLMAEIRELRATAPKMQAVLEQALIHVQELREAWMQGALAERDGQGGTRSNRNAEVEIAIRAVLAEAKGPTP